MNLVGKILVGLIALFSIVFMTLVLAVYASHVNWREAYTNEKKKADDEASQTNAVKTKLTELQKTFDAEKTAWANVASAEREWRKTLQQENDSQKVDLSQLEAQIHGGKGKDREGKDYAYPGLVSTLDLTQMNQADLYNQINGGKDKTGADQKGLMTKLAEERTARETFFKKAVDGQERVQQLQNVLDTLRNRQRTLVADAQRYHDALLRHNVSLNLEEKEAPDVKGRVIAIGDTGLVEIDIGRDAGLRQGHQLHVYRDTATPSYLGKVEVIRTYPERAVCKILPEFKKGPIQRDDYVAAQIRFE